MLSIEIPVIKDSWQSSFSLTVTYDSIPAIQKGKPGVCSCKKEYSENPPSLKRGGWVEKGQGPSGLCLSAWEAGVWA